MGASLSSLYVCYLSLRDPLVETQVVAYLEGLAARGHTIHLLTFEPRLDAERSAALRDGLARRGITWHALRYHKRPSLPATIYDALAGALVAARLVRRHRLDAIHARNHVPAAMALIVRRLTRSGFIFDMRGLMAEEYSDAGRWREGGLAFRITKRVESAAIRRADGMVVLTERVREHLFGDRPPPALHVIPCCADLDRIDGQRGDRERAREELGLGSRPVLVYVGKFGGWYMEREMVDFFDAARAVLDDPVFLIVTQEDRASIERELARHEIPASDYVITSAPPEQLGRLLAAADVGISFIRRCLSKISSSPTKVGEYLGAGLPVISSAGIGDLDSLLGAGGVGVLVEGFADDDYRAAATELRALMADPATAGRCRALARARLSLAEIGIPRYDALYREVSARRRETPE
jgi:glycosyltransferase involved in cell wall biosynthesis